MPEVQVLDDSRSPNFAQLEADTDLIRPEGRFFTPSLHDVRPPELTSPPVTESLLDEWKDARLLVLGGNQLRDKAVFARHLAWRLADDLRGEEVLDAAELPVLQWFESNAVQHIEESMARPRQSMVFVFANVQSFHFGHDLSRFLHQLDRHKHFAILTTLDGAAQWQLALENCRRRDFWHDLDTTQVYTPEYLTAELRRQLLDAEARWPAGLFPDGVAVDRPLCEGAPTLNQAARRLESPGRLRSFVLAMTSQSARANAAFVEEQLLQLAGDTTAVKRWYRQLESRQQLFTLGMLLLDGLFDDQLFAALEMLVDASWRSRDPGVAHFDYADLSTAGAYFLGTSPSSRAQKVHIPSGELRSALFEVGWLLHRRTVQSTLPYLTRMLVDSTRGPSTQDWQREHFAGQGAPATSDQEQDLGADSEVSTRLGRWVGTGRFNELFGTPERQQQFRHTMAITLGELGRIGGETIEVTLLELAQNGNLEVQTVTALALAYWREGGREQDLFNMLGSWLDDTRFREWVSLRLRQHRSAIQMATVRSTVAVTVGFASLYDPPNRLAEPLVELFQQLFFDATAMVGSRLSARTVPMVLTNHLGQLQEWIRSNILAHPQLLPAVARGFSLAVATHPEWAGAILVQWHEHAKKRPRLKLAANEISQREVELWIVAISLGQLPAKLPQAEVGPDAILDRLREILEGERHPFVRKAVFAALAEQIRAQEFRTLVPYLRQLMGVVAIDEREFVIARLRQVHRVQWSELKGGEDELEIDGVCYPIFVDPPRPSTRVERVLEAWIQDPTDAAVQQLALEAYGNLGNHEIEQRIAEHQTDLEQAEEPAADPQGPRVDRTAKRATAYSVPALLKVLLWLLSPWNARRRKKAQAPLAQALAMDSAARTRLIEPLERSSDAGLQELARDLRRGIRLHERRRALGVAALGLLVALLVAGFWLGLGGNAP